MNQTLRLLSGELTIVRLLPEAPIPPWLNPLPRPLVSVTRTPTELSIVCPSGDVPNGVLSEAGWRAFTVEGKLEFSAIGILAGILNPLAEAGISILSISTFDTDYVLVRTDLLDKAKTVLLKHFELVD